VAKKLLIPQAGLCTLCLVEFAFIGVHLRLKKLLNLCFYKQLALIRELAAKKPFAFELIGFYQQTIRDNL